jgi:hypothetical protein
MVGEDSLPFHPGRDSGVKIVGHSRNLIQNDSMAAE